MTTFEAAGLQPVISVNDESAPFWEGLQRGELLLPHCHACDAPFFYPRVLCPRCGSRDLDWQRASGSGELHSFCVSYQSSVPGLSGGTPFATGLVDLDEGVRLMAFLVGFPSDPELIRCGTRVRARFLALDDGRSALAFAPEGGDAS
jgi:uncharacterized OB-fold protein